MRRWERQWAGIESAVAKLPTRGQDWIRLAKQPSTAVDGFAGGSGGERHGEGDHGDPAFSQLSRLVEVGQGEERQAPVAVEPEPDLVAKALGELFDHVDKAHDHLRAAERLGMWLDHRADGRRGRQPSGGNCMACKRWVTGGKDDKIRMGYCDACRKAWDRYAEGKADPSHPLFQKSRESERRGDSCGPSSATLRLGVLRSGRDDQARPSGREAGTEALCPR